jgi:hypothetical protein
LQVVVSPCGTWPFPTLSLQSIRRCLALLPRGVLPVHLLASSQETLASRQMSHVRHTEMIPAMQFQQGGTFRGCRHLLMFRLPRSLGPPIAPTAEASLRAAGPFTPRNLLVGYLPQAVVSLRIQHEQLMRLDFHQQDCSLVGCSDIQVPLAPSPSRRVAKGPRHVLRPPRRGTARRGMAPTNDLTPRCERRLRCASPSGRLAQPALAWLPRAPRLGASRLPCLVV